MIRGRWIWDRATQTLVSADEFYARKYADAKVSALAAPMVVGDTEPYRSIIDGSVIGGRRQHRDHLKAHGCVELGNEMPKSRSAPSVGPVAPDIQRAMQDEGLRAQAKIASEKAKAAVL